MDDIQRTNKLVQAITSGIMSTVEVASERLELSAAVASVQQRMEAFETGLEIIHAQKVALKSRMADCPEPMKKLYEMQIEMLTQQETSILERASGQTKRITKK